MDRMKEMMLLQRQQRLQKQQQQEAENGGSPDPSPRRKADVPLMYEGGSMVPLRASDPVKNRPSTSTGSSHNLANGTHVSLSMSAGPFVITPDTLSSSASPSDMEFAPPDTILPPISGMRRSGGSKGRNALRSAISTPLESLADYIAPSPSSSPVLTVTGVAKGPSSPNNRDRSQSIDGGVLKSPRSSSFTASTGGVNVLLPTRGRSTSIDLSVVQGSGTRSFHANSVEGLTPFPALGRSTGTLTAPSSPSMARGNSKAGFSGTASGNKWKIWSKISGAAHTNTLPQVDTVEQRKNPLFKGCAPVVNVAAAVTADTHSASAPNLRTVYASQQRTPVSGSAPISKSGRRIDRKSKKRAKKSDKKLQKRQQQQIGRRSHSSSGGGSLHPHQRLHHPHHQSQLNPRRYVAKPLGYFTSSNGVSNAGADDPMQQAMADSVRALSTGGAGNIDKYRCRSTSEDFSSTPDNNPPTRLNSIEHLFAYGQQPRGDRDRDTNSPISSPTTSDLTVSPRDRFALRYSDPDLEINDPRAKRHSYNGRRPSGSNIERSHSRFRTRTRSGSGSLGPPYVHVGSGGRVRGRPMSCGMMPTNVGNSHAANAGDCKTPPMGDLRGAYIHQSMPFLDLFMQNEMSIAIDADTRLDARYHPVHPHLYEYEPLSHHPRANYRRHSGKGPVKSISNPHLLPTAWENRQEGLFYDYDDYSDNTFDDDDEGSDTETTEDDDSYSEGVSSSAHSRRSSLSLAQPLEMGFGLSYAGNNKAGSPSEIRFGSLTSLVNLLTDTRLQDPTFVQDFLFTHHFIMSTCNLVSSLITRYQYTPNALREFTKSQQDALPPLPGSEEEYNNNSRYLEMRSMVRVRILKVFATLVQDHYYHLEGDPDALKKLLDFIDSVLLQEVDERQELGYSLRQMIISKQRELLFRVPDSTSLITIRELAAAMLTLLHVRKSLGEVNSGSDGTERVTLTEATEWFQSYFRIDSVSTLKIMMNQLLQQKFIEKEVVCGGDGTTIFYRIQEGAISRAFPKPLLSKRLYFTKVYEFMDLNPIELARQLTLIEEELFAAIQPRDFNLKEIKYGGGDEDEDSNTPGGDGEQREATGEGDGSGDKPEKSDKSESVQESIAWFNQLTGWIATEIVSASNIKKRVLVLQKFISIADMCLTLKNYSSLVALVLGMEHPTVSRLKETRRLLPKKDAKKLAELVELCSVMSNFLNLRNAIKADEVPPLVPYMAILLRDVTLIFEGNQSHITVTSALQQLQPQGSQVGRFRSNSATASSTQRRGSMADLSNVVRDLAVSSNSTTSDSSSDLVNCHSSNSSLTTSISLSASPCPAITDPLSMLGGDASLPLPPLSQSLSTSPPFCISPPLPSTSNTADNRIMQSSSLSQINNNNNNNPTNPTYFNTSNGGLKLQSPLSCSLSATSLLQSSSSTLATLPEEKVVNFEKFKMLSKVFTSMKVIQRHRSRILPLQSLQDWLRHTKVMCEDDMRAASYACEPPAGAQVL
eukprot:TRINITY_DN5343_c0_g1_i1.p1 TRINITY_DN5343_c0_g1~~TRINITY_DN5343_c0_g1_i1.p1  ORF type:complete len:1491 (+),score=346.03 TRINITY_DN5343_c0_g1_i1:586-5058(+)